MLTNLISLSIDKTDFLLCAVTICKSRQLKIPLLNLMCATSRYTVCGKLKHFLVSVHAYNMKRVANQCIHNAMWTKTFPH